MYLYIVNKPCVFQCFYTSPESHLKYHLKLTWISPEFWWLSGEFFCFFQVDQVAQMTTTQQSRCTYAQYHCTVSLGRPHNLTLQPPVMTGKCIAMARCLARPHSPTGQSQHLMHKLWASHPNFYQSSWGAWQTSRLGRWWKIHMQKYLYNCKLSLAMITDICEHYMRWLWLINALL